MYIITKPYKNGEFLRINGSDIKTNYNILKF